MFFSHHLRIPLAPPDGEGPEGTDTSDDREGRCGGSRRGFQALHSRGIAALFSTDLTRLPRLNSEVHLAPRLPSLSLVQTHVSTIDTLLDSSKSPKHSSACVPQTQEHVSPSTCPCHVHSHVKRKPRTSASGRLSPDASTGRSPRSAPRGAGQGPLEKLGARTTTVAGHDATGTNDLRRVEGHLGGHQALTPNGLRAQANMTY